MLGGSTARQQAQAGRWKYSIPWMSCLIYEWELARGQEALGSSHFQEFESPLVQEFEFFWELCDFGVPWLLLRDCLIISISFVALLNCFYLNPRVSLLSILLLPSLRGE